MDRDKVLRGATITERRTGQNPINIAFAGENTLQINMRVQISEKIMSLEAYRADTFSECL